MGFKTNYMRLMLVHFSGQMLAMYSYYTESMGEDDDDDDGVGSGRSKTARV